MPKLDILPGQLENYSSSPETLPFRTDITLEERAFIKRKHIQSILSGIIGGIVFTIAFIFVGKFLMELNNEMLHYIGIGLIVVGVISVIRMVFYVFKSNYGVCDNGVLVKTFRETHHSHTTNSSSTKQCVSVWFPDSKQYCRRIEYAYNHYDEFDGLKRGDEIKVYRINNKIILANCPEPYKLRHY